MHVVNHPLVLINVEKGCGFCCFLF